MRATNTRVPTDPALSARWMRLGSIVVRVLAMTVFSTSCFAFYLDFRQTGRYTSLAWVISEALVIVLFLLRRPTSSVSRKPQDWVVGLLGTLAVLLVRPTSLALVPTYLGLALQLAGTSWQVFSKAYLGRSFWVIAANRGVVQRGPYRLVRHPIYLGYLTAHVGFVLTNFSTWNLMIYALAYLFQIMRIFAEEKVLKRDRTYAAYAARTPHRLLPYLF